MTQVLPLLAASALVGILHMSAPDHWVTLCVLGRKAGWSRARLSGVGVVTAGGHVVFSVLLGFGIVLAGITFSSGLSNSITLGTGALMLVVGAAYGTYRLTRNADGGSPEPDSGAGESGRRITYFLVLGGALSPT